NIKYFGIIAANFFCPSNLLVKSQNSRKLTGHNQKAYIIIFRNISTCEVSCEYSTSFFLRREEYNIIYETDIKSGEIQNL
ncbi:hypothetical protein L9F63_024928, partial [Diploptera punctata]